MHVRATVTYIPTTFAKITFVYQNLSRLLDKYRGKSQPWCWLVQLHWYQWSWLSLHQSRIWPPMESLIGAGYINLLLLSHCISRSFKDKSPHWIEKSPYNSTFFLLPTKSIPCWPVQKMIKYIMIVSQTKGRRLRLNILDQILLWFASHATPLSSLISGIN